MKALYMKSLLISFLSFSLIACDGLDLESIDETPNDLNFSRSEFTNRVFFSSLLLNGSSTDVSDTRDGFVALFNSSRVDEIELGGPDTKQRAFVGDYAWTIVNERLQVTYTPGSGAICTSRKTSETSLQVVASATCENGDQRNDRIAGTLIKPLAFSNTSLETRTITIKKDDDTEDQIEFSSSGSLSLITNPSSSAAASEEGMYSASTYNNVVRLNFPTDTEYSLWVLLEGSLDSGKLLDLRYNSDTNVLKEVRIYNINADDNWETESLYNSVTNDS